MARQTVNLNPWQWKEYVLNNAYAGINPNSGLGAGFPRWPKDWRPMEIQGFINLVDDESWPVYESTKFAQLWNSKRAEGIPAASLMAIYGEQLTSYKSNKNEYPKILDLRF